MAQTAVASTGGSVSPRLVAALDHAWSAIRRQHPDVPEVVVALGSGSDGRRVGRGSATSPRTGGSAATAAAGDCSSAGRAWRAAPSRCSARCCTSRRTAWPRRAEFSDTSRQGRWHNARFRDLAAESRHRGGQSAVTRLERHDRAGRDREGLPAGAPASGDAITAFRHAEPHSGRGGRTNSNNGVAARCELRPPDPSRRDRARGRADHLRPVRRRLRDGGVSVATHLQAESLWTLYRAFGVAAACCTWAIAAAQATGCHNTKGTRHGGRWSPR